MSAKATDGMWPLSAIAMPPTIDGHHEREQQRQRRCSRRRDRVERRGAAVRTSSPARWSLLRSLGSGRRRSCTSRAPRASPCAGSSLRDQPAAQHHVQRVGQADQLVEVGGDQQHGEAAGRARCAGAPRWPPARRRRRRGSGGRRSAPRARHSSPGRRSASAGCRRRGRTPATSEPGVRTSYAVDDAVRCRRGPPCGRSRPPRALGWRDWCPRMRFSHSGDGSSSPCRCRSSGM